MLKISIDKASAADVRKAERDLRSVKSKLENREPALRKMKTYMVKRWGEHIRSGTGAMYGGWSPLRPYTVAKRGASGPILNDSGTMIGWVNTQNKAGIVSAQSVQWNFSGDGSGGSYAVFHDGGYYNVRHGVNVAARKVWDVNEEDENRLEEILDEYVERVIAQYF